MKTCSKGLVKSKSFLISFAAVCVLVLIGAVFAIAGVLEKAKAKKIVEQIDSVNVKLSDIRKSSQYIVKDSNGRAALIMEALSEQADSGNVIRESVEYDKEKQVVTYFFKSGLLGIETLSEDDYLSNASESSLIELNSFVSEELKDSQAEVLILNALDKNRSDFDHSKEIKSIKKVKKMYEEWKELGINVKYDDEVDLEDITKLKGYKFVYLILHGNYYDKYFEPENLHVSDTFISTNVRYEGDALEDFYKRYADYIKYKRIKPNGDIAVCNGCFAFSSEFINSYYKDGELDGSIFFFGSCQLMGSGQIENEKWIDVLNKKSVSAVVGFHNSVDQEYAIYFGNSFFLSLVEGKTANDSYSSAINECGKNDHVWIKKYHLLRYLDDSKYLDKDVAEPKFGGNKDARLKLNGVVSAADVGDAAKRIAKEIETTEQTETSPVPTPAPTNPVNQDSLSNEQGLTAITNYLCKKYPSMKSDIENRNNIVLDIDTASSKGKEIVVVYNSNTGDHYRYIIERVSGETYSTVYVSSTGVDEKTGEVFNARDYLDSSPSETTKTSDLKPLTDDQARTAITNYLYENYQEIRNKSYGEVPCYWDIDKTQSNNSTAVVYWRSYTAAFVYFYIERVSGETYVMASDPGKEELKRTGETFNARDYLKKASPTTSATPTTKPAGKTKVTEIKKTYKSQLDGSTSTVKIPKVTIEGVNTSSINKELSNTLIKACTITISGKKHYVGGNYQYYIGKTYISIIMNREAYESDPMIFVFNISRKTGKKLNRKGMLKELGISSNKFETRTLKAIKKVWNPMIKSGAVKTDKYLKSEYNEAISKKTLKRAVPCVNSKGKICCYIKQLPDARGSDYNDHVEPI